MAENHEFGKIRLNLVEISVMCTSMKVMPIGQDKNSEKIEQIPGSWLKSAEESALDNASFITAKRRAHK